MKLAGVVGWPVRQSLSPRIHGLWIAEHRFAGAYVALPVRREDFSSALGGLRKSGFVGVNVTLPHKEAAFALAEHCDLESRAAGAANLLLFHDRVIEARNTDVEGLAASLCTDGTKNAFGGVQAAIIGAGGAARAAVLACDRLGVARILVFNRTRARADRLVAELSTVTSAQLAAEPLECWPPFARATRLLVQATSAEMGGGTALKLALDALPNDATVCDIVYDPLETPLLACARARGLRVVDGLDMLVNQAIPSFEALFGIRPVATAAMRRALEESLQNAR